MNIYNKKRIWKLSLLGVSIILFICSIIYSNILVNKIEEDERKQVQLWAEAIQEKAELVTITETLFSSIADEEKKKVELLAVATKKLEKVIDSHQDLDFYFKIIKNNSTIPVILTDDRGNILSARNVPPEITSSQESMLILLKDMRQKYAPIRIQVSQNTVNYMYYNDSHIFAQLKLVLDDYITSFISDVVLNTANVPVIYTDITKNNVIAYNIKSAIYSLDNQYQNLPENEQIKLVLMNMKKQNKPILVDLKDTQHYVYYLESETVSKLKLFPYIQFIVIIIFITVAYILFSTSRKAEQDQVWVGMSKETAHQLGTPISSMLAWIELLKAQYPEDSSVYEMERDINRLGVIADRFEKIGSTPNLTALNVYETVEHALYYLKSRVSKRVDFILSGENKTSFAEINRPLFEWVIENISKNAVDAMEGKGSITFLITEESDFVHLDIRDTGKGMSKKLQSQVFEPGITTKKRGWGLGLTLAKRIINTYHEGKISVLHSEIEKGTTFRISLKKSS